MMFMLNMQFVGRIEMKKKLLIVLIAVISLFVIGCNSNQKVEGDLADIMTKLYAGIKEDELPMMLSNIELNSENISNYAFVEDISFKEAIASESMIGSIPHSIVLIRLDNDSDASSVVKKIKENANPRKWICVTADNVIVKSRGDLVILIMSNDLANKIATNFDNL